MGISIKQIANKLIRRHRSRDPFLIASEKNIIVRSEDLPSSVRGMAVKVLRRRYIVLNCDSHDAERRLVCAHELGHHVLHPGNSYQFIEEHSLFVSGKYEREANTFAAYLLIDSSEIETGETEDAIAWKVGVPRGLMKYYK